MKAYELAWKLLKNGPFCKVELYGAIDNKSVEVRDIRYVGKRCVMSDEKYVNVKGVTRVAGFGEEVDTYGEAEEQKGGEEMTEAGMVCKKCGSDNVTVQAVTEIKTKKHGLLWWLLIGWWWWTLFFGVALVLKLFGRNKVTSKTHNVCVCQNCGYSWNV